MNTYMDKKNYKTILNKDYKVTTVVSLRIKVLLFKNKENRVKYLEKKCEDKKCTRMSLSHSEFNIIKYIKCFIAGRGVIYKYILLFDTEAISISFLIQSLTELGIDLCNEHLNILYFEKTDTRFLGYTLILDIIDGFNKNGYIFCSASNPEMLAYERE